MAKNILKKKKGKKKRGSSSSELPEPAGESELMVQAGLKSKDMKLKTAPRYEDLTPATQPAKRWRGWKFEQVN